MGVQTRGDVTINQNFRSGNAKVIDDGVFLKDTSASADIAPFTVVAKNTDDKYVVLADATKTDGTAIPRGITVSNIAMADIKAADVTGQSVIVGGDLTISEDQISLGGSVTLDTIVTAEKTTVRSLLAQIGIFPESVNYVSGLENS